MVEELLLDENLRLAALSRYEILDTAPEEPFDRITRMVRAMLDVPIATISFIDSDRQWFKSRQGLDVTQTTRETSFCTHTIQQTGPLVVPDARRDSRFRDNPAVKGPPHIASYLGAPLLTPDNFGLGALCAIDTRPRQFSLSQLDVMQQLAALVVDWLEMRRIAQSDFLTGAMSRRTLMAEMEKEMERARRYGRPSALALFDIDHFKVINDTYGHPAGDELLKAVSAVCRDTMRAGDILGRTGGEEFALLLPETDPYEALHAAERARAAIAAIALPEHPEIRVTASFGVAALSPTYLHPQQWVSVADRELYRAKHEGRNRCCLLGENTDAP